MAPTPTASASSPPPAPASTVTTPKSTTTTTTTSGNTPTGNALQLPNKGKPKQQPLQPLVQNQNQNQNQSSANTTATTNERDPLTSMSKSTHQTSNNGGDGASTNVEDLMDAVGASGVDINAEEDSLKHSSSSSLKNALPNQYKDLLSSSNSIDLEARLQAQHFIDSKTLADVVRKIAAEYQLKALESSTIPLIALAVKNRLQSLIERSFEARQQRRSSHFLREPVVVSRTKRRKLNLDREVQDQDEEEEQGVVTEREKEPLWDSQIQDEPEKWLNVLEKVDREEERRRRRERVLREEKEQQAREEREAIEASERIQFENEGNESGRLEHRDDSKNRSSTPNAFASGSGAATGRDETPKPKPPKKKKRELGQAALAKNVTETVQKRLTDQVAMRSLGGRNFAWLSGSGAGGRSGASSSSTPGKSGAPGTPEKMTTMTTTSSTLATPLTPLTPASSSGLLPSTLTRFSTIPGLHDANRQQDAIEQWRLGANVVEMSDVLFAIERERGVGIGRGAGKVAALKARAGVIRKA